MRLNELDICISQSSNVAVNDIQSRPIIIFIEQLDTEYLINRIKASSDNIIIERADKRGSDNRGSTVNRILKIKVP